MGYVKYSEQYKAYVIDGYKEHASGYTPTAPYCHSYGLPCHSCAHLSFLRRQEFKCDTKLWIPAFAGMTRFTQDDEHTRARFLLDNRDHEALHAFVRRNEEVTKSA